MSAPAALMLSATPLGLPVGDSRLGDDRWQAAEESGGRLTLEQVRALIDEAPRDRARVIQATDRQR